MFKDLQLFASADVFVEGGSDRFLLCFVMADPAGFVDAVGQEAVIVRMRPSGGGAVMWCVFDSARVAATTALWIAESLWFPFS